jgi:sigma-E factor negative regulatory protein RseC
MQYTTTGMIEQQGRVVAVKDGIADVRLGGTAGCALCDAGKGCGAGVFGRLLKRKPVTVSLDNTVDASQGQPVMVGIPEALFLRLAARLYLYPLLAGIGGAVVGYYISDLANVGPVGADMITLVSGLICGIAVLRRSGKSESEFSGSFMVHLLRVIEFQETRK